MGFFTSSISKEKLNSLNQRIINFDKDMNSVKNNINECFETLETENNNFFKNIECVRKSLGLISSTIKITDEERGKINVSIQNIIKANETCLRYLILVKNKTSTFEKDIKLVIDLGQNTWPKEREQRMQDLFKKSVVYFKILKDLIHTINLKLDERIESLKEQSRNIDKISIYFNKNKFSGYFNALICDYIESIMKNYKDIDEIYEKIQNEENYKNEMRIQIENAKINNVPEKNMSATLINGVFWVITFVITISINYWVCAIWLCFGPQKIFKTEYSPEELEKLKSEAFEKAQIQYNLWKISFK